MKWMLKTPRGVELEEALFLAEKSGYDGAEIQLYDLPDGEEWKRNFVQISRKKKQFSCCYVLNQLLSFFFC